MADISERIEKQMEGTNLALAAVAEVLQKMDGRLAKEEQDEEDAKREDEMQKAQSELVKSVAAEVVSMLKASEGDSYAGADVSGDERKASPTGGTPQSADDSESDAGIDSKIEDQPLTWAMMMTIWKKVIMATKKATKKRKVCTRKMTRLQTSLRKKRRECTRKTMTMMTWRKCKSK